MCSKFQSLSAPDVQPRDIRPSDIVTLRTAQGEQSMRWGFRAANGKGLLINARAESAAQKPTFASSLRHNRCIISASAFYEWDADKRCYLFTAQDNAPLHMAGLYTEEDDMPRFVILTQEANSDVSSVHHRMPCILPNEEYCALWLQADALAEELLSLHPHLPLVHREYSTK